MDQFYSRYTESRINFCVVIKLSTTPYSVTALLCEMHTFVMELPVLMLYDNSLILGTLESSLTSISADADGVCDACPVDHIALHTAGRQVRSLGNKRWSLLKAVCYTDYSCRLLAHIHCLHCESKKTGPLIFLGHLFLP